MSITATERTQIVELTTLMFNAAPGATYLSQIVALYEANGHNLSVLADQLASTSIYQSMNPSFQTAAEFATKFLTPLGLQGDAFATSWITSQLNAGVSKQQVAYAAMQALMNLDPNASAQYQAAKAVLVNKTTVAEYYSATLLGAATDLATLQNVIAPVTSDVATVQSTENALSAAAGQTFTLTTGIDNLVGGVGNDTFNATDAAGLFGLAPTLNPLDSIDGGAGSNTLNVTSTSALSVGATDVTVKNIQTANVVDSSTVSLNTKNWSGLTALNVKSAGTTSLTAATSTNVTAAASAGTVSISGGLADTVTGTDSVSVTGAAGAVSITTKVPTTAIGANPIGVMVTGGTTVSVTETAGTSSGGAMPLTGNATAVTIGAAPSAVAGATTSGYPQVISGLSSDPTGNVTVSVKTAFTDTAGLADVAFGAGTVTAYMNGGTSATVTGAATVAITDVQTTALQSSATAAAAPGTSTLASVMLDGISTSAALTSDALTYVSVVDSKGTVTVNNSTAGHGLGVTVGNDGTSGAPLVIADATATSLTINSQASSYAAVNGAAINKGSASYIALDAAKATSLTFANAQKITLNETASTLTKLATITDTGSGALNLGDVTGLAALTTIDASGASGAVTATIGAADVFMGGSGDDVVTLTGALTKTSGGSISLGGGNDTLLDGGASIDTGVTVDGGSGTNTISASLVNVGNAAGITNFQILDVSGYGSGAGAGALDASLLGTPVSGIAMSASGTNGTATLLNLAANVTITDTSNYGASDLVITHAGTGPNSLTVNFAPPAGDNGYISSITSTGDTTVAFTSNGGTPGTTDNVLNTITASGGTYLYLGNWDAINTNTAATTATADVASSLTTIDASATTGGVWIAAGGSQAIGGSGFNTTYDGLTIKGGTGGDTIYNFADHGTIIGGATAATTLNYDNDTVSGLGAYLEVDGNHAVINDSASAAADTLVAGGNSDSITVGSGKTVTVDLNGLSDTVTLGSGNGATVNVADDTGAALSDVTTVNFGAGTANVNDNLLYHVTASTTSAATNGDMLALNAAPTGDTVAFAIAPVNTAGALGAAVSVSAAQTIDQAIYYADQAAGATQTVVWFEAGGNTYVVDTGAAAGTADDQVIKIVGLHDLSHATIGASGITFA
jgi:hypothetical protein